MQCHKHEFWAPNYHVTSENNFMCWEYSMPCSCPSTGREEYACVKLKKDTLSIDWKEPYLLPQERQWTCTLPTWLTPWLPPCMWGHSATWRNITNPVCSVWSFLCPCWWNNFWHLHIIHHLFHMIKILINASICFEHVFYPHTCAFIFVTQLSLCVTAHH